MHAAVPVLRIAFMQLIQSCLIMMLAINCYGLALVNLTTGYCRCLEGLFDSWGTFGFGFNGDLEKGGPTPIGAKKANLSATVQMYMEEVALNEQVTCSLMCLLPSWWSHYVGQLLAWCNIHL